MDRGGGSAKILCLSGTEACLTGVETHIVHLALARKYLMVTSGGANQELEKRIHQFLTDTTHLLDLSRLGLTEIPTSEDLFPQGLTPLLQIHMLAISHNDIRRIPHWITQCADLRSIIACDNRIQELPESIGEVRTLEHLDLRNNKLWILPHSMAQLTSLKSLYLHNNFLDLPPEVLGDEPPDLPHFVVPHLLNGLLHKTDRPLDYTIDYSDYIKKTIKSLATELYQQHSKFSNMRDVWLMAERAVLSGLSKERDPAEILSYYFRIREDKRPLNEGAVGKTSLVNRLVSNSFNEGEKKTEGIKITEWPIR